MGNMFKYKVKDLLLLAVFLLFMFQNVVNLHVSFFRYTDEIAMLLCAVYILKTVLFTEHIHVDHFRMIVLMLALVSLGLLSNLFSDIDRSYSMIARDIVYFFKVYICFIGASMYFQNRMENSRLLDMLAGTVRFIIFVAFVFMILSQKMEIGMTRGVRYGIKCFKFVYSVPGMFSQYCIIFLNILSADLNNHKPDIKRIFSIILLFIVWASTGRSRGFAAMAIWVFLVFVSHNWNRVQRLKNVQVFRIICKPQYVIIIAILALCLGWGQITEYFGANEVSARGLLLEGGINVMQDYFPLGSGFGTYGTETAATFYSPLYYRYGLNTFYSLVEGGDNLTDCYWPAVGGTFGIFGIPLMGLLIMIFLKQLIALAKGKKYFVITSLTYAIYLVISSTATGAFCSYITAEFIIITVAIMANDTKERKKRIQWIV